MENALYIFTKLSGFEDNIMHIFYYLNLVVKLH